MKISAAPFEHAVAALVAVLRFDFPADAILSRYFREHRELGPADRTFVAEAVFGVLRKKRLLDHVTGDGKARALLFAWLARMQGMNTRELDSILRRGDAEIIAVIKAASTDELTLAQQTELPDWVVEKLLHAKSKASLTPSPTHEPPRSGGDSTLPASPPSLRSPSGTREHLKRSRRAGESEARGPKAGRDATFMVAIRDTRAVASLPEGEGLFSLLPPGSGHTESGAEGLGMREILDLGKSLSEPAPLDLRVNTLRAKRDDVMAKLAADGLAATPTPYAPNGLRLGGRPSINRHPLFLDGTLEVQDEGSQILCSLLAPTRHDLVIDFCAGAGGKTLALGALMHNRGRLYAFDVSAARLKKLQPRLARSGLSNVHPQTLASENDIRVKRLAGKADRVLIDAPCSGLGTLRRNPDLKWRQSPQSVAELARKQAAILRAAAAMVKPGGRVLYATCSLLPDENETIVEAFLAANPAFRIVDCDSVLAQQNIALRTGKYLRLSPHLHGTDGFFGALLTRAPAQ